MRSVFGSVAIYAKNGKGERRTLLRIHISDLKKGRLVVVGGQFDYIFQVIESRKDGNSYKVALRNYGVLICKLDEIVEVVDGSWDENGV